MMSLIVSLGLVLSQPGAGQPGAGALVPAEAPIVAEARAFMGGYARDLIAGDRTAVAGRYDRRGANVVIGRGAKPLSHAEIAAIYADPRWSALPRFQWHDLMYLQAGPESVVVAGRFSVQRDPAAAAIFYSYSNLLVRQDGQLRIRMEHETPEPVRPVAR